MNSVYVFKRSRILPIVLMGLMESIFFFVTYNIDQAGLFQHIIWINVPVILLIAIILIINGKEKMIFTEKEIIHQLGKRVQHRVKYGDIKSVSFEESEDSSSDLGSSNYTIHFKLVIQGVSDYIEIDRISYRRHVKQMLSLIEHYQKEEERIKQ